MGTVLGCVGNHSNGGAIKPASSPGGNPRNKTALKPGRSLMDWVRLGHSGNDLAGTAGRMLDVTPQELAKHNKRNDCWMALKGKVYNVTPYMEYHPGGEDELMRGVGTDATDLFNEVHKWVNFETMLQKCLVGRLVEGRSFFLKPNFLPLGKNTKNSNKQNTSNIISTKSNSLTVPTLGVPGAGNGSGGARSPMISPLTPSALPSPKYDWFQTNAMVNIAIYTKWKHITKEHVVIVKRGQEVKVVCYIQDMVYTVHLELQKPIADEFRLKTGSGTGKVDVLLDKMESGVRWSSVGKALVGNGIQVKAKDKEIEYVECSLGRKETVTHDTRLFVLEVPKYTYLPVPLGYHIYIKLPGRDVVKPYTPVASSLNTNDEEEIGQKIHLFIKIYPEGALTPFLEELSIGSSVEVSLPEGSFTHEKATAAVDTATDVALLGAGTGVTPMIKIMLTALKNKRRVHLILFNKNEGDIPWREELNGLVESHPSLCKVSHVLSRAGDDSWSGLKGHVRKDLLEQLLPVGDGEKTVYMCVCGPTVFTKLAVNLLKELGHTEEEFHAFLG